MGFSDTQIKKLSAKLNARHVRTRVHNGTELSYIEGWHAIAEANRVFGYDGWDRETLKLQCIWERNQGNQCRCGYLAHVRIKVRAGDHVICREASGLVVGKGSTPGAAHEQALKGAETDATKRALTTFGNIFGLALYDKQKRGVRAIKMPPQKKTVTWTVLGEIDGGKADFDDPVAYCTAVKSALEKISERKDVTAFWNRNWQTIAELRETLPELKTDSGKHYGDVLEALYCTRRQELATKEPPGQAMSFISKGPKRIRDHDHLRYVANQPCLLCGRRPSHAHHLKHVQPRALGKKPSDQWTVPLCAIHHRELHDYGDEAKWWKAKKVDARDIAERLWTSRTKPEAIT